MTWVRTPGLSHVHIIFPLIIICRRNVVVHSTLLYPSIHASNSINLKAMDWRVWWTPVNAEVCKPRKSERPQNNGPDFSSHTSTLGPEPPTGLQFPIFCLSYILFFNCYLIFFIILNLINYFTKYKKCIKNPEKTKMQ